MPTPKDFPTYAEYLAWLKQDLAAHDHGTATSDCCGFCWYLLQVMERLERLEAERGSYDDKAALEVAADTISTLTAELEHERLLAKTWAAQADELQATELALRNQVTRIQRARDSAYAELEVKQRSLEAYDTLVGGNVVSVLDGGVAHRATIRQQVARLVEERAR